MYYANVKIEETEDSCTCVVCRGARRLLNAARNDAENFTSSTQTKSFFSWLSAYSKYLVLHSQDYDDLNKREKQQLEVYEEFWLRLLNQEGLVDAAAKPPKLLGKHAIFDDEEYRSYLESTKDKKGKEMEHATLLEALRVKQPNDALRDGAISEAHRLRVRGNSALLEITTSRNNANGDITVKYEVYEKNEQNQIGSQISSKAVTQNLPFLLAEQLAAINDSKDPVPPKFTYSPDGESTKGSTAMATNKKKLNSEEAAIEAAEKRGDAKIVRAGNQITIPEDMTLSEARIWLKRKEEDEETMISVMERVDVYPFDGAIAFSKALTREFGFTSMVPPRSFFDSPPLYIGVEVGVGVTEQVPWGKMAIPNVDGILECGITKNGNGQFVFQIGGEVKKKDMWRVKKIADDTRKIAREESIYRGKAIRMKFEDPNPLARFNPNDTPKFFDLSNAERQAEELTFSENNARVVKSAIWTPIEKTKVALKNHINLKRGILLAGKPGVGKTLTAVVTADKAVKNGWTFIYLESVKFLQSAIHFAHQYAPAVIFAEDIDRVTQERDEAMNEILNVVDGIDTKSGQTMIVLTTNHLELIKPVMLRPGRIDTVIELQPPDAAAAERLVRVYARDENNESIIRENEDLTEVGKRLAGQIPAVIAEVVAKSKLTALEHLELEDKMELTKEDLETSAIAMMEHIKLLDRKEEVPLSDVEMLGNVIGSYILEAVESARGDLSENEGRDMDELFRKFEIHMGAKGTKFVHAAETKQLPANPSV